MRKFFQTVRLSDEEAFEVDIWASIEGHEHLAEFVCSIPHHRQPNFEDTAQSLKDKQNRANHICAALTAYEQAQAKADSVDFRPSILNGVNWSDRPKPTIEDLPEGAYLKAGSGDIVRVIPQESVAVTVETEADHPLTRERRLLENVRLASQEEIDAHRARIAVVPKDHPSER